MEQGSDAISRFYLNHFGVTWKDKLTVDCPFCEARGFDPGQLIVFLNRDSFFHGYFRCRNRCVPGGYPLWFATLAAIPLGEVPGYDRDGDGDRQHTDYPVQNINEEIRSYQDRITEEILKRFKSRGVSAKTLLEMQVGFNGRYVIFPYVQNDGNCYSARCVHPEKAEDFFWHGNEDYSKEPFNIFNVQDVGRCENGALFICEGEENVLPLKQLGFPAVGVSTVAILEKLPVDLFEKIETLFICINSSPESANSARNLASLLGYKARILRWPANTPKHYSFWQLALDSGSEFATKIGRMIKSSRAFSPFVSPVREFQLFQQTLTNQQGDEYQNLSSGFPIFDDVLNGVHGINVIGGAPKVGKSTYMIQIGAEMALRKIPVLYYDFENGRQKIYQRTLSRLARVQTTELNSEGLSEVEKDRVLYAKQQLEKMLFHWRVINDRKITPELMRKHIEFIRHETRSVYTVVVIDSLHKLPFNEFTERRTGIDAWLRQMESIRDELQVSFLVISELSRGAGGAYGEEPHLGVFKGSGDIEYSADNAMVLYPGEDDNLDPTVRKNCLWLVASREHSPGRIANYHLDYPFWGFKETPVG
ncbi:MAG: AAA family ATPase [Desulfobulbaceae bacterium]|nr:AAA family ATPase [Desulfobulbaceae bacterium]